MSVEKLSLISLFCFMVFTVNFDVTAFYADGIKVMNLYRFNLHRLFRHEKTLLTIS